ncbi:MAG: HlyC/CorC family transporter [Candidatus Krumholzibacteriota bacterium]|nr:HlyC/CorC family transporter [Candidatus Krumholzibacteriota bacterium]
MEFGETRVREVMVPRIDIVAISSGMNREEAVNLIVDAGHSRIPVYEDTIDRVIGVIYTKDLLRQALSGSDFSLRDLTREAFFVPESKMIDELLTEFRARRQHLAVVVDEYGGTAGIVTLEDVLEEIVGDIQDEFDSEEELIRRIDADSAVCNAKVRVDELNEALGIHLSNEVADSLGGILYHMIGQIPRVGDSWALSPLLFEIQSIERQRIDKVLITGLASAAGDLEDSSG